MDSVAETSEGGIETERFNLQVTDKREKPDAGQQFALSERIKNDKIDVCLAATGKFLGEYLGNQPNDLSVSIIDGKTGEGTIRGNVIEVQLTGSVTAISEMRGYLEPILPQVPDEEKNQIAAETVYATTASTALHEGVHGLLDSKPGSKFHTSLERVSGTEDSQAQRATLVDEGIAYAVQGLHAPEVQHIGSLAPMPQEGEKPEVTMRKTLGERLQPKVKEYIEGKKPLDDVFLKFANEQLQEVQALDANNTAS